MALLKQAYKNNGLLNVAFAVGIALAMFVVVAASHAFEFAHHRVTVMWSGGALAFWCIYRFGSLALIPIVIGAEAFHFLVLDPYSPAHALGSIATTLSAWLAVTFYRVVSVSRSSLHTVKDVILLLIGANMIQSIGSASAGTVALWLTQPIGADTAWPLLFFQWLVLELTGNILCLPLLMTLNTRQFTHYCWVRVSSTAAVVVLLLLAIFLLSNSNGFKLEYQYPALLASLPVCIWVALRKGIGIVVGLLSTIVMGCVVITLFSFEQIDDALLLFVQIYASIVMVCSLILYTMNLERNTAMEASREHMQLLEKAVEVRTEVLREKVQETEALATQLRQQSYTDYLTGIANRRAFVEFAEARLNMPSDKDTFLFLLDIDYFKLINDQFGHSCGDECLMALAGLLNEFVKDDRSLAARVGGEEFIFLSDCESENDAIMLANVVRKCVAMLQVDAEGVAIQFTVSIGVSSFWRSRAGVGKGCINTVLQQADHALYCAKRGGRNRVALYEQDQPLEVSSGDMNG